MVVCSQCGSLKAKGNHWFLAWSENAGQRFCFISFDSDPAIADEDGVQKLCGRRCLQRTVQAHAESLAVRQTKHYEMAKPRRTPSRTHT